MNPEPLTIHVAACKDPYYMSEFDRITACTEDLDSLLLCIESEECDDTEIKVLHVTLSDPKDIRGWHLLRQASEWAPTLASFQLERDGTGICGIAGLVGAVEDGSPAEDIMSCMMML